jgi:hypothetical protein
MSVVDDDREAHHAVGEMHDAKPGDRVVAVLGTEGHQHLRVLWADGGESTVYAGADVRIEHVPRLR